jgi:hypothetical protein
MGWVFAAIESVDFTRSQLKAELIYGIRKPVLQSASSPTRQSRPANPVIPGLAFPAAPPIPSFPARQCRLACPPIPSFPRKRESHNELSWSGRRRVSMVDHPASTMFGQRWSICKIPASARYCPE